MRAIAATIEKLAKVNTTVLITGESGVGKNVVARLVHHLSDRTNGPLVEINCAGIPAPLLESELFGYEAGGVLEPAIRGKKGGLHWRTRARCSSTRSENCPCGSSPNCCR